LKNHFSQGRFYGDAADLANQSAKQFADAMNSDSRPKWREKRMTTR
jgi:hypothetical protein